MSSRWENRTADYVDVINTVYLAIRINHTFLRIGTHASCPQVVRGICIWQFLRFRQILLNMPCSVSSEVFVEQTHQAQGTVERAMADPPIKAQFSHSERIFFIVQVNSA